MSNSSWQLPTSNHYDIVELRSLVQPITIHRQDSIRWHCTPLVSVTTIWNCIRLPTTPPGWLPAVWHPLAIPKCSFTLWLALKERLLTKDRMLRFHMHTDLECVLCNNAIESHHHLFGSCSYIFEALRPSCFSFTENWTSYINGHFLLGRVVGIRKLMGYLYIAVSFYLSLIHI